MSSYKAIGGYFELELPNRGLLHSNTIALNTARNSFEYLLSVRMPRLVYVPKYTCEVMLEPLKKLGIDYRFYSVDINLEINELPTIASDELLLYTNYFGIKDKYSGQLAEHLGRSLIIDCSQAFYFQAQAYENIIYSPRKFFGVPDGGYLHADIAPPEAIPRDTSYLRSSHLLERIDLGPEAGYRDFQSNDKALSGLPVMKMSTLTERILRSIDYRIIKEKRQKNFMILHELLKKYNTLKLNIDEIHAPMVYPLMVKDADKLREVLHKQRIYTATYWPNVLEWCEEHELEFSLVKNIIALPVDQRYNETDMLRIAKVLYEG